MVPREWRSVTCRSMCRSFHSESGCVGSSQENGATFLSLVMNIWNTVEIIVLTVLLSRPVRCGGREPPHH